MGGEHILVLGGAGDMGRHAVWALTQFNFVERIVVAGLAAPGVDAFIDVVSNDQNKVDWVEIDLEDEAALHRLMGEVDIVLNATGPFFKFGLKVARAALAEKKHYFDICDDVQPTLDILALHEEAKAAGITMVTGLGASPGITNLLAVQAAEALDEVYELDTSWDLSAAASVEALANGKIQPSGPKAASVHWMHACSGKVRLLKGGRWIDERPLQQKDIQLPDGQSYVANIVAHPEIVTLPRKYPDLQSCINLMSGPEQAMEVVRYMRDRIDAQDLTVEGAAEELSQLKAPTNISLEDEAELRRTRDPIPPVMCGIANGVMNGKPSKAAAWINHLPPGGMGASTGIPLALGAVLLRQGKIVKSGAFAPEDVIEPSDFFALLEPYCHNFDDQPLVELSCALVE